MYEVTRQGLTLLNIMHICRARLWSGSSLCVDGYTQQVYTTGGAFQGVSAVRWEDSRLTALTTLTCVGVSYGVGVLSPHTLCACDESSGSVKVIRVTADTVTDTLRKPAEVADKKAFATAVLGSSILILYGERNLVLYKNGASSPGTMVAWPAGLEAVSDISSDAVSRFLVCDYLSKSVFILDENGKLCDRVNNTYLDHDICRLIYMTTGACPNGMHQWSV